MAGLSVAKIAAVAQMANSVSDAALAKLVVAVKAMPGAPAAELAALLTAEAEDRWLRERVFGPLAPLFVPRTDGVVAFHYPPAVKARLWKDIRQAEADLLKSYDEFEDEVLATRIADHLCRGAAQRLRTQPGGIWPDGPPEQIARLAVMFDLAPMARRALPNLKAWAGRPTDDQIAELRLLFKDASSLTREGAERILDLLFAHIADAALVLRVMVLASGAASKEEFLSGSELAGFVDRLIEALDRRIQAMEALANNAGVAAAKTAAADMAWCADVLGEMAATLHLQPDSLWGRQAAWLRSRIVKQLTAWLASAEKAVDRALPLTKVRISGGMIRPVPDLTASLEGPQMDVAMTLLTVIEGIRPSVADFGCEGPRRQLAQNLSTRLSSYADEVIETINAGATDEPRARGLVERAAVFLILMGEAGPAKTIRRRLTAAGRRLDPDLTLASGDAIR